MPIIYNPYKKKGFFKVPSGGTKKPSDASFSYAESSYAKDGTDPTPTITGDSGGTFTATPSGLTINSSTGEVTLSTSTINSYTVKYTLSDGTFTTQTLGITAASFSSTKSMSYDGIDDYIGVNSLDTSVLPTGSFSVSVWFYATANGHGGLFQIGDFAGNTAINFNKRSNGALRFIINLSGGSFSQNTLNNKYNLNEWNHAVLVFDNSITTGAAKFYINGVLDTSVNESPSGQTISYPSGSELRLGQYNSSGTTYSFFSGNIDETALFNSALTSSDVTSIYNSGVPADLSSYSPTAWYRMGENGSWKSTQWLLPENSNKDKISNFSFEFDGVDDYIDCGNISALNGVTEATWMGWFNRSGTSSYYLFGTWGTTSGEKQFVPLQNGGVTGSIVVYMATSTGVQKTMFKHTYNVTATIGNWHHYAFVYNEAESSNADKMKVYMDGVELANTLSGAALTSLNSSTANFEIGKLGGYTTNEFSGNIDEVAVFTSALSSSDISSIYNSGTPTTLPAGAVAHYKMGEAATFSTNWTVPDQIGSNDGTSANMTIEDRTGNASNSTSNALSYNMTESDREEDTPS
tara:strand:+ start:2510 stop:4240 length:1731 start_codon:yes stop_codon:yes gene_type:complete